MGEWNYTNCTKPFETAEAASTFMKSKDFAGFVLQRQNGYSAVCPTYPNGYYADAVVIEVIENSKGDLAAQKEGQPLSACC